jgi:hypothetical protein
MKRLTERFFYSFNELSDWVLDQDDIEVVNVQKIDDDLWYLFYFDTY